MANKLSESQKNWNKIVEEKYKMKKIEEDKKRDLIYNLYKKDFTERYGSI